MIETMIAVEVLLLAAVLVILRDGRARGERLSEGLAAILKAFSDQSPVQESRQAEQPAPERATGRPAPVSQPADSGIWQELHPTPEGGLLVHQWVREDSPAWRRAYDTPGVFLRRGAEGETLEGLQ